MQLFTIAFQRPVEFGTAFALAFAIIFIAFKSAKSAEGRQTGWVRAITSSNARILFAILFIVWALVFGIGLQFVPHEGANSPYGALGLIALFSGFFIMMGFLWAVIGE
ncbi:MAG TPA: hypothetical protein VFI28_01490 [Candidatus Limnocylindrales bacterium]|nr:hypothetical protein [Candidatus Limnocylindrales bacterium]